MFALEKAAWRTARRGKYILKEGTSQESGHNEPLLEHRFGCRVVRSHDKHQQRIFGDSFYQKRRDLQWCAKDGSTAD